MMIGRYHFEDANRLVVIVSERRIKATVLLCFTNTLRPRFHEVQRRDVARYFRPTSDVDPRKLAKRMRRNARVAGDRRPKLRRVLRSLEGKP